MQSLRSGILRSASLVVLVLAVTACSSGGSSAPPASNVAQASTAVPAAPSALATGTVAVASVASGGGTGDCPATQLSGFQKYTLAGFEAEHFCGPAKATVTLGSTTVQISGGSCITFGNSFAVTIGTELFGSPDASVQPDVLVIDADATTGAASPSGVVAHTDWIIVTQPVVFGPGKTSGTVSGTTINPGSNVQVNFTCS